MNKIEIQKVEEVFNNYPERMRQKLMFLRHLVNGIAAGLVTCFELFSTFSCKPLINIHDVIVLKKFRGNGLSQKMLKKV